jgi:hypothetical protein
MLMNISPVEAAADAKPNVKMSLNFISDSSHYLSILPLYKLSYFPELYEAAPVFCSNK